jgi:hypothetical protein
MYEAVLYSADICSTVLSLSDHLVWSNAVGLVHAHTCQGLPRECFIYVHAVPVAVASGASIHIQSECRIMQSQAEHHVVWLNHSACVIRNGCTHVH